MSWPDCVFLFLFLFRFRFLFRSTGEIETHLRVSSDCCQSVSQFASLTVFCLFLSLWLAHSPL